MNACILVKMACVDNYVAILIPKTVFNYLAKSRFIRCGYCPTIQVRNSFVISSLGSLRVHASIWYGDEVTPSIIF